MGDAQRFDYHEVFESLSQPLAVCHADGALIACNASGRMLLGVESFLGVRLGLNERETFSGMQVNCTKRTHEFFMADVPVYHAQISRTSMSMMRLSSGDFRICFVEGFAHSVSPSGRVLRMLGRATEHAPLFEDAAEVAALLGSCLVDIFPAYAFRLEVRPGGKKQQEIVYEQGYPYQEKWVERQREHIMALDCVVPVDQFLWSGSRVARRVVVDKGPGPMCVLQIETASNVMFTMAEERAFSLFIHIFSFMLTRHIERGVDRNEHFEGLAPILNQLHVVVILCDARRAIRMCNRAFESYVGQSGDELIGSDVAAFFEEDAGPLLRACAASALSGATTEPFGARLLSNQKGVRGIELSLHAMPSDELRNDARSFLLIGQVNANSLNELQDEFARAEQLMQLGQLATGVAHELKNPLTSILNYADYLLQKYRDQLFEKRDSERLVRIIEGVERMDQFVRDLVTLARPQNDATPEVVDVHDVVRQAVHLCELAFVQSGAVVSLRLDAAHALVQGIPSQLLQVFVNLMNNASIALLKEGGDIEVETRNEGDVLKCMVRDTGCGMAQDRLVRIFEPFYTTHRGSGGSGLGLVLVRSIIDRHGGSVEVESKLQEGTTFSLVLPIWTSSR